MVEILTTDYFEKCSCCLKEKLIVKSIDSSLTSMDFCKDCWENFKSIMEEEYKTKKVFLGGTCNGSTWRDFLIKRLKIDYFNPVVEDWTIQSAAEEIKQRVECDFCLYVITPMMEGVYSIAEVVDDSNKRPEKTILCILEEDDKYHFNPKQLRSLNMVASLVNTNGAKVFHSLEQVAEYLNNN